MTIAVRAASHFGTVYVAAAAEVIQVSLEPVGTLAPLLPFPSPLFLFPFSGCGCFRHSWEPFSSFLGVSLDACVLAGNIVVFFVFSLFSPYPSLPRAQRTYKRGLRNRFSMRFGFHRFSSPPFGSLFFLFSPSHTSVFLFSFMSSCLHVLALHSVFPLRTHWPGPLSVYVHIHIHFKPRFQVAQVL